MLKNKSNVQEQGNAVKKEDDHGLFNSCTPTMPKEKPKIKINYGLNLTPAIHSEKNSSQNSPTGSSIKQSSREKDPLANTLIS
jgi:hypothetical protein